MKKISPLLIVKHTPGSNCGECGHPSCLAFGAALVAGTSVAGACPYLDTNGLDLPQSAVVKDAKTRDLELIAHLKQKLRDLDFAALAPGLGAEVTAAGALEFPYLGRRAEVGKDLVLFDGHEPGDHRDQILLYNYVAMGGGSGVAGEWVGMESLPNSISKIKTLAAYAEEPLARLFAGRKERAAGCLERLGGRAETGHGADLGVVVPVLPRLPVMVLFWDEDAQDQFAARVKLLFDRDVLTVLDLESMVFAAERLAEEARAVMEAAS